MDTQILEDIGFTKGEIKVYLALLGLGSTTSGPIILESDVSRSKVYEILDRLKDKGMVSESIQKNTKYFQAASPERILDYIEAKEGKLKDQKTEFKKVLPQLLLKQKLVKETQEVKVFVGFEGVKSFYRNILNKLEKGDEYLAMTFSDVSLDNRSIVLMFNKFHQRRAEIGAKAKILAYAKEKAVKKKMDYSNTKKYEFRVTDQLLPTGIAIVKDTVATFNWGKVPRVFVTICKENAEQYRKFFYSVWDKAKR